MIVADKKAEALRIVEEGLKELESAKGSVAVAVQKLSRAAKLVDNDKYYIWAEIQLGNQYYNYPLKQLTSKMLENFKKNNKPIDLSSSTYKSEVENLEKLGIEPKALLNSHFIELKCNPASGGLDSSIHVLEDHLPYLKKNGNDKTLYLTPVQKHIAYIKKTTHSFLSTLHNELKFSGTITSSFDLLKNAVDDRLLDLDLEIAEQLMLAFKSVSSNNKEEWSHALTTCRRLLESLADKLYPASDLVIGKRTFKQNQHVNRLWQFMNEAIESDTNKEIAKTHVDYLGLWLERTNKISNKGVHDEVSQLEATKAVFHLYLMLADLLDYLDPSAVAKTTKPKITDVTLDEIEALLNVKRDVAKAIVIARVKNSGLTIEQLAEVKGVGTKTIATAKEVFEF